MLMKKTILNELARILTLSVCVFMFTACGGGDSDDSDGAPDNPDNPDNPSMTEEPYFWSKETQKKIRFAPGNIQYNAALRTWRFAPNQWETVGADNINISPSYDGWIDLFGWATSGWSSGAVCYEPWSNSVDWTDYWRWGHDIYTPSVNYNLNDPEWSLCDWGVYNKFSNDNSKSKKWRTMTRNEWIQLECSRGLAVVGDVKGFVLLPTNWVQPNGVPELKSGAFALGFRTSYTLDQWKIAEKYGAVFLPVTGYRLKGQYVEEEVGRYWTAERIDAYRVWCYTFGKWTGMSNTMGPNSEDWDKLDRGMAVRLVQDIEE